MYGRMSLFKPAKDLEERFGVSFVYQIEPRYNIAPGDDLDVITNDDPDHAHRFHCGLIPHWVDDLDDFPKPINARVETVSEKASFLKCLQKRR